MEEKIESDEMRNGWGEWGWGKECLYGERMDKVRGIWVVHKQIRIAKDFSISLDTSPIKIKIKMMILISIWCLLYLQSFILRFAIHFVLS